MNSSGAQISMRRAALLICHVAAAFSPPGASSLVKPSWLMANLGNENLRVLDVTQKLDRKSNSVSPAYDAFASSHIPGATFVDVGSRLSAQHQYTADGAVPLHNMHCTAEQFAEEMCSLGIDDESHIVLYSSKKVMWATRVWWMLQSYGFRGHVSILDGGLSAWKAAGGEVASLTEEERNRSLTSRRAVTRTAMPARNIRPGAFVGKGAVLDAISDPSIVLVDSLKASSFLGTKESRYGRRGHIVSALSVPYTLIVDEEVSGCFNGRETILQAFAAAGLPLEDGEAAESTTGQTLLAY